MNYRGTESQLTMLHTRVSSWLGRRLSPLRLRESERVFIGKSKPRHRRIVLPADQHQGYSICVYRRSRLASLSQGSTALKMDFHRFSYMHCRSSSGCSQPVRRSITKLGHTDLASKMSRGLCQKQPLHLPIPLATLCKPDTIYYYLATYEQFQLNSKQPYS